MAPNLELEKKVIQKFIEKSKQERFIQFSSDPKNRRKFINELAHFKDLKWDMFSEVKGIEKNVILESLQKNNIPAKGCYLISQDSKLDTKTLEFSEAIKEVIARGMGTIIVFGDA